jgi:hypothetical protein
MGDIAIDGGDGDVFFSGAGACDMISRRFACKNFAAIK